MTCCRTAAKGHVAVIVLWPVL